MVFQTIKPFQTQVGYILITLHCGQFFSSNRKHPEKNAIKSAQCMFAMCPSTLQTKDMVPSALIKGVIPLVDADE